MSPACAKGFNRGERNGQPKLTEALVCEISALRAGSKSHSALARMLNVSEMTVSFIVRGQRWSHLVP